MRVIKNLKFKMLFSDIKKSGCFSGRVTYCAFLGILALVFYLGINPFVHRFVIMGGAVPEKQGLKVELFDRLQTKGKPVYTFFNSLEKLTLEKPDSSLIAYGLWRVPQSSRYILHLECDDYGELKIDGKRLIHLSGINARNIGEAEVNLEEGYHVLVLHLFNGPGKGWLTLKARNDRKSFSLLAGDNVTYLKRSSVETWLKAALMVRRISLIILTLCLLALAIQGLFYSGSSQKESGIQKGQAWGKRSALLGPFYQCVTAKRKDESHTLFFLNLLFSFLFLIGIFCLPSGVESPFDGLPWSRVSEVLVLAVVLPFLLLVGWEFLTRRYVVLGLMVLCGIKLALAISTPASGWSLRIYENPQSLEKGLWEESYEGIWKPGISGLLDRPFNERRDFPLEWLNRYNNQAQRVEARPVVEVWGQVRLPQGKGIVLVVGGSTRGIVWAKDAKGHRYRLPLIADPQEAALLDFSSLPQGPLEIRGEIFYGGIEGREWSLIPLLMNSDKSISTPFGQGILWRDQAGQEIGNFRLTIYGGLAWAVVLGVIIFLLCWMGWILGELMATGIMDSGLAVIMGLSLGLPSLLQVWKINPQEHLLSILTLLFLSIAWVAWKREKSGDSWGPHLTMVVLLTIGPMIVRHYWVTWMLEAGKMTFFSVGDDWSAYQKYAREIILQRDYWHSQNSPLLGAMPFYRYIIGLLHLIFGQSVFTLKMLDVWSIVAASTIIVSMGFYFGLSFLFALFGSWVYLFHEIGDRFSWWIGSGLQEHAAMMFLMVTCLIFIRAKRSAHILWAGLVGSLGFWLRFDHLPVLASAFFLTLEPLKGSFAEVWGDWLRGFRKNLRWLGLYFSVLFLAVLVIFFRNWIFSGQFVLVTSRSMQWYLSRSILWNLQGVYTVLCAYTDAFSWSALTLWLGTIFGIVALLIRKGPLRGYPLGLGLILLSTILPYFRLWDNAYPPRFSIHLLPLASLSLTVLLYTGWNWARFRAKRNQENPISRRTKRIFYAIIVFSVLIRLALIIRGGQFYFPDENGIWTAYDFLKGFLKMNSLDSLKVFLSSFAHIGYKIIILPFLLIHLEMVKFFTGQYDIVSMRYIPALLMIPFSVGIIILIFKISLRSGANEEEGLLAMILGASSVTLAYFSRHLLPYDISLFFILTAIWMGLRERFGFGNSFLCGIFLSLGFLVYSGYWLSCVLGTLLLIAYGNIPLVNRFKKALALGAGIFALFLTVNLIYIIFLGTPLFTMLFGFASTINQGEFSEGWSLPWRYLWDAEHGLLLIWILGGLFSLIVWVKAKDISLRRIIIWFLIIAGIYLGLSLGSSIFKRFVVYGRLARQMVPFFCILSAVGLSCFLVRFSLKVKAILVLIFMIQVGWNFYQPLQIRFPNETRLMLDRKYGQENITYGWTMRSACGANELPQIKNGRFILTNATHFYPIEGFLPQPKGEIILSYKHPLSFLPYQYEGYPPYQRERLRSNPFFIQLIDTQKKP